MSVISEPELKTLADLLETLGNVPPHRIRLTPALGTATEKDVVDAALRQRRLCELVDGVLVEKPMGYVESILAACLVRLIGNFVIPRNLGHVTGEAGMLRLFPGLVRIPDVAFASWECFPNGRLGDEAIPTLAPDLVVEVLSKTNTAAEMKMKIREYFSAGVKRIWVVDPPTRTLTVFASEEDSTTLGEQDVVDAAPVLQGLSFPLRDLFAELDRHA